MNFIKRFTTTVTASLDNAVGNLENHDAIIDATIRQTQQSAAATKARINTLNQQLKKSENQLNTAKEQSTLWEGRALKLANTDERKALQCLARRNHCKQTVSRLVERIEQQKSLIAEVTANLNVLQSKLDDMSHKHNQLRSRQAVADVNRAVRKVCGQENINDTFERWEAKVLQHEGLEQESVDPLDAEFTKQETEEELLEQLAELKVQHHQKGA